MSTTEGEIEDGMVGVEEPEGMGWAIAGKVGLALEKAGFETLVAVENANAVVADTPRVMTEHLMVLLLGAGR